VTGANAPSASASAAPHTSVAHPPIKIVAHAKP
jgi:hypothetical protein